MFTSNLKEQLSFLERYEDLSSCKIRFDKISSMKLKIEENESLKNNVTKQKDGATLKNEINALSSSALKLNEAADNKSVDTTKLETGSNVKSLKITFNQSNPRGRPRSRHRDSKQMKACKQEIQHNKAKADQRIKKTESKNTLAYFLNEQNQLTSKHSSSAPGNEVGGNEMISDPYYLKDQENSNPSEIHMSVFKSNIISNNNKENTGLRKNISLKDLMFYLERNKQTYTHQIILYKLISKLNG